MLKCESMKKKELAIKKVIGKDTVGSAVIVK